MREMILNISLVAIATAIFRMIIPDSSLKKQTAFLAACYFALSAVNICKNGGVDLSALTEAFRNEGGYVDFSAEEYRITRMKVAESLSERLKEILAKEKIYPEEIFVIVDISGSYSISITEIRLVFLSEDAGYAQTAERIVMREVGDEIKVVTEIKA